MSVDLSPSELGFKRPLNSELTEVLRLTNPHDTPIAFKVKTTAPKQYCVRPNSGVIQPYATVDVQVLLQAMKEEPPLNARCRDKFLVQSAPVNAENFSNAAEVWSEIEKTAKASIQERKIRVNFLPADNGSSITNGVAASTQNEEQPPPYSSPSPQFGSPAARSVAPGLDHKGDGARSIGETNATSSTGAASSNMTSTGETISKAVPKSQDELKQRVGDVKAQGSKMASQLADPEVRQRKTQEASEKVQTAVQQTGEAGVPVHIVAGLCLLSFLLAYFFF